MGLKGHFVDSRAPRTDSRAPRTDSRAPRTERGSAMRDRGGRRLLWAAGGVLTGMLAWGHPGVLWADGVRSAHADVVLAAHHAAPKHASHGRRGAHPPAAGSSAATGRAESTPAAGKPPAPASHGDGAEAVETVEAVEAVDVGDPAAAPAQGGAPAAGPTGGTPLTVIQVIAHLHPALVHLPIAWAVLWAVWEVLALRYAATFRPTVVVLAWLCVAAFVPATITGLLHLQELPEAADVRAPALLHRNLIFACALCSLALAALATRWHRHGPPGRPQAIAALLALWLQVGVIGYAAHIGGKMVYGDDYLPF